MFNEPDDDYGRGQQIGRMVIVGRRLACGHRMHGLNTSSTFSANTQNTTMAGDTARITSINFDGVLTALVENCAAYVIQTVTQAGYGDNVRISGVTASALVQDGTVTSGATSDSDDDVMYMGSSPAPAARAAVPVEAREVDGEGDNESSGGEESGSGSGSNCEESSGEESGRETADECKQ